MTLEQSAGLLLVFLIMGVGMVGCIVPGIPGTSLVFLAALGHRLYFGSESASLWVLALMAGIMLLSVALDYLASVVGAARFGASRKGMWGVIVGATLGLFFSLPGILIGPFLGALLFEWIGGQTFQKSARAGLGATVGMLAGAAAKIVCCGFMIVLFAVNVLWRGFHSDGIPGGL